MKENAIPPTIVADAHSIASQEESDNLKDFKLNRRLAFIRSFIHFLCRVQPNLAVRLLVFLFLRPRRRPISYLDQLPDGAEPIRIFHNLLQLKGYQWGRGDKTVLLVHGWESHLGHMLPLVQPLVSSGYKVIAFDGPGHGQSPQLLSNMFEFGDAVRAAIEQHGPIHAVVAKSFGGGATALVLARQPELQIARLILISPMNHIRQHIGIFNQLAGMSEYIFSRFVESVEKRIGVYLEACDVADALTKLTVPTLILHDCEDRVIPISGSRELARIAAHVNLVETRNLGHKSIVRSKQISSAMLGFLRENAG